MRDEIGRGNGKYTLSTNRNSLGTKFGLKLDDNTLKA